MAIERTAAGDTVPVDVDFDDELNCDDVRTYVTEDFQRSTMDFHAPDYDQLENMVDDDQLASAAASYEHSSTVRNVCILGGNL